MCRTERFNSGIIRERKEELQVSIDDILSFAQGQDLLDTIQAKSPNGSFRNLPLEYVKSAPYLCSFMDRYELKRYIAKNDKKFDKTTYERLYLNTSRINNYKFVSPSNAKLQYLHNEVFGTNHEKGIQYLLWMPASRPYYRAGGKFETVEAREFSKILIFSSWEMVPRMISIMMSYYAELYTLGEIKKRKIDESVRYTSTKGSRYGENRFKENNRLIIAYPCNTLAICFTPHDYFDADIAIIRRGVKAKITEIIDKNPILSSLPRKARNKADLIVTIMKILDGADMELEEIPSNTLDVLTDIAIASPAVCALRISQDSADAERVGRVFESIFNSPEAAAIIDLLYNRHKDDDYYESVLDYCVKGNLQAVFDEYAHVTGTNEIAEALESSNLRDVTYNIEAFDKCEPNQSIVKSMRANFAVQFVNKAVTDKTMQRITNVRNAFNSPLRPFILSSTSVGQEGLDFHLYARKVLHWNLPSNPVDLEQREGRVNRYECLAIRRNVSKLYGADTLDWTEMFSRAEEDLKSDSSEMVPYWCLPLAKIPPEKRNDLQLIERLVPIYPLSRDVARYERLINVLSLYRMTLGHPRQEELLSLLSHKGLDADQLTALTIDLCPFNKLEKR